MRPFTLQRCFRALLFTTALLPVQAQGTQGVFPKDPFYGLQVTYSLSGVSVRRTQDAYPPVRSMEGRIAGNQVRIVGLAKFTKGDHADLKVVVRAGDQHRTHTSTLRPEPGQVAEQPFDVEVQVPAGAEVGSITLSLSSHHETWGAVTVQVSANLLGIDPSAAPVQGAQSFHETSRIPTPVAETFNASEIALRGILDAYRKGVPKGLVASGPENNLLALWNDKYDAFTSGGHQARVLALLDKLRTGGDPVQQAWFEYWQFGPVEIHGSWHQAVVLWPAGSRWAKNGFVLDPWLTQTPEVFPIQGWANRFGLTPAEVRPSAYNRDYPTHGLPYGDPSLRKPSQEEATWLSRQPRHFQERGKALPPEVFVHWLRQAYARRELNARLLASGPMDTVLGNGDGKLTGFLAGRGLSDIPGLLSGRVSVGLGEWWSEFHLPTDNSLVAQFMGTGNGTSLVYTGSKLERTPTRGSIEKFAFPVQVGNKFRLAEPAATANPVIKGAQDIPCERARIPIRP